MPITVRLLVGIYVDSSLQYYLAQSLLIRGKGLEEKDNYHRSIKYYMPLIYQLMDLEEEECDEYTST